MERPSVRIGPAVGQVWEGRQRRRDGTRERVRIADLPPDPLAPVPAVQAAPQPEEPEQP